MASGEIQLQNISLYSPRLSDSAHTINDAHALFARRPVDDVIMGVL